MNPPAEPRPRQRRSRVRRQARLDAETPATLAALTRTFHRKRAAILRSVMPWGLAHTQEWTVDRPIPDRPRLVHLLVDPELLQHVQAAAEAHVASVAAWLRHAMRQVSIDDFPASWRAGDIAARSHESGHCGRRFMLRFDDETLRKLKTLTQTFQRSAAEVFRQLVAHARPEELPESWPRARTEHREEGDACTS